METGFVKIDKTSLHLQAFLYVHKAIDKDDTRPALRHVKVEADRIIGCDGKRLHIVTGDFSEYEAGLYEIEKATKSEVMLRFAGDIAEYPNVDKVMPKLKKADRATFEVDAGYRTSRRKIERAHAISRVYTRIILTAAEKTGKAMTFNFQYVEDALLDSGAYYVITRPGTNDQANLVIEGEHGEYALVMGLAIEK